jgi:hypothetical protein
LSGSGDLAAYGIHALRMMVPAGRGKFQHGPERRTGTDSEIPANGSYTMATVVSWPEFSLFPQFRFRAAEFSSYSDNR